MTGPRRPDRRPRRPGPPAGDDPAARERARRVLDDALDRGADLEAAARRALAASPECVEAWLLLADVAPSPEEARTHVRRAVDAATQALGEAGLREGRGRMADTPDGVAYLHALAALARTQWGEDRAAQAVQTMQHALAADPRDPVAVRGDLLLLLLALGRDDEAEELVARFPHEQRAVWSLARALVRRRRALDTDAVERATAALDRAIEADPAAARALAGLAPSSGPDAGADPVLAQAFEDTEGAVEWLRARVEAVAAGPAAVTGARPTTSPDDASADRRFSAREHVEEAAALPPARREPLLRRALELWPDAADAWRALAELATTPAERVERLREAVAAGRRAIGRAPDAPAAPVGDSEDARALLAARDALALALRAGGDEDAALAQERALLDEDPDDPLGVGVRHVARLLALGRDAEAEPWLAARAEDASPGWSWARVLAARRRDDRVAASFALAEATMTAPTVGPLLLAGGMRPPRPDALSADAFDEARRAADTLRAAFEATPGALAWLAGALPRPPAPTRRPPRRRPPGR